MPAPRFASPAASLRVEPGRDARREHGDHRVARTRDVEHLARLSRQRMRLAGGEQRHALLAASHEQRLEIEIGTQLAPLAQELVLRRATADHGLELVRGSA